MPRHLEVSRFAAPSSSDPRGCQSSLVGNEPTSGFTASHGSGGTSSAGARICELTLTSEIRPEQRRAAGRSENDLGLPSRSMPLRPFVRAVPWIVVAALVPSSVLPLALANAGVEQAPRVKGSVERGNRFAEATWTPASPVWGSTSVTTTFTSSRHATATRTTPTPSTGFSSHSSRRVATASPMRRAQSVSRTRASSPRRRRGVLGRVEIPWSCASQARIGRSGP